MMVEQGCTGLCLVGPEEVVLRRQAEREVVGHCSRLPPPLCRRRRLPDDACGMIYCLL